MSKLDNLTPEEREQYNLLLQEIIKNTDPTEYMPPSVREVARMDMDTLKIEYDLIVAKQSTRSSAQRRWIAERYVYESSKQQEQHESAE
jgi:hypothetical protein